MNIPTNGQHYQIEFWRSSQYESYTAAKASGAVYKGEPCHGYIAYADAVLNIARALECCGIANYDGLMVRLTVDHSAIGNMPIQACF